MFRGAARTVGAVTYKRATRLDMTTFDLLLVILLRGNLRELTSTSAAAAVAMDKAVLRVKAGAGAKAELTARQVRGITSFD
jgi:hypothetical protein